MTLPDRDALLSALELVRQAMPPTPQQRWPLLDARCGAQVWVKHENHTPVGAFKLRGGLVYIEGLKRREPRLREVVSATRGNHGQSIAFAAARHGLAATIVVPRGNSVEKNAAMRALGARLVEHGDDFDEARVEARRIADEEGIVYAPSFAPELVLGVATYALELFRGAPPLDALYVPIGLGSGICGCMLARDLLGLPTEIIGVQSTEADAYARWRAHQGGAGSGARLPTEREWEQGARTSGFPQEAEGFLDSRTLHPQAARHARRAGRWRRDERLRIRGRLLPDATRLLPGADLRSGHVHVHAVISRLGTRRLRGLRASCASG